MEQMRWIPVTERLPEVNTEVLMSFDVFKPTCVGRYEIDDKGGAFYFINSEEPCMSWGYHVNAWMPLPKPYREEEPDTESTILPPDGMRPLKEVSMQSAIEYAAVGAPAYILSYMDASTQVHTLADGSRFFVEG